MTTNRPVADRAVTDALLTRFSIDIQSRNYEELERFMVETQTRDQAEEFYYFFEQAIKDLPDGHDDIQKLEDVLDHYKDELQRFDRRLNQGTGMAIEETQIGVSNPQNRSLNTPNRNQTQGSGNTPIRNQTERGNTPTRRQAEGGSTSPRRQAGVNEGRSGYYEPSNTGIRGSPAPYVGRSLRSPTRNTINPTEIGTVALGINNSYRNVDLSYTINEDSDISTIEYSTYKTLIERCNIIEDQDWKLLRESTFHFYEDFGAANVSSAYVPMATIKNGNRTYAYPILGAKAAHQGAIELNRPLTNVPVCQGMYYRLPNNDGEDPGVHILGINYYKVTGINHLSGYKNFNDLTFTKQINKYNKNQINTFLSRMRLNGNYDPKMKDEDGNSVGKMTSFEALSFNSSKNMYTRQLMRGFTADMKRDISSQSVLDDIYQFDTISLKAFEQVLSNRGPAYSRMAERAEKDDRYATEAEVNERIRHIRSIRDEESKYESSRREGIGRKEDLVGSPKRSDYHHVGRKSALDDDERTTMIKNMRGTDKATRYNKNESSSGQVPAALTWSDTRANVARGRSTGGGGGGDRGGNAISIYERNVSASSYDPRGKASYSGNSSGIPNVKHLDTSQEGKQANKMAMRILNCGANHGNLDSYDRMQLAALRRENMYSNVGYKQDEVKLAQKLLAEISTEPEIINYGFCNFGNPTSTVDIMEARTTPLNVVYPTPVSELTNHPTSGYVIDLNKHFKIVGPKGQPLPPNWVKVYEYNSGKMISERLIDKFQDEISTLNAVPLNHEAAELSGPAILEHNVKDLNQNNEDLLRRFMDLSSYTETAGDIAQLGNMNVKFESSDINVKFFARSFLYTYHPTDTNKSFVIPISAGNRSFDPSIRKTAEYGKGGVFVKNVFTPHAHTFPMKIEGKTAPFKLALANLRGQPTHMFDVGMFMIGNFFVPVRPVDPIYSFKSPDPGEVIEFHEPVLPRLRLKISQVGRVATLTGEKKEGIPMNSLFVYRTLLQIATSKGKVFKQIKTNEKQNYDGAETEKDKLRKATSANYKLNKKLRDNMLLSNSSISTNASFSIGVGGPSIPSAPAISGFS